MESKVQGLDGIPNTVLKKTAANMLTKWESTWKNSKQFTNITLRVADIKDINVILDLLSKE